MEGNDGLTARRQQELGGAGKCLVSEPEGCRSAMRRHTGERGYGVRRSNDRLPLSRARQETAARTDTPIPEFMRHVLESWVLAQHAYWSVGSGLADARARGRILLRLRIILDEGGWTLTPGASRGNPPRPTADRLHTAITLATECGLFN
jgi:hypothetical protein